MTAVTTTAGTSTAAAVSAAPVVDVVDEAHRVRRRRRLSPGRQLPAARLLGPLLFAALWALASAAGALDPGAIPALFTT